MSHRGAPNHTRLALYETLATNILENSVNPEVAANLLLDVRFSEIPIAFAEIIFKRTLFHDEKGEETLQVRFSNIIEYVTFMAFGTTERAAIPSWFFQNYESFLASCIHKILLKYDQEYNTNVDAGRYIVEQAKRAFTTAFDLCAGAKSYLSLDCLGVSSNAHSILVICNHSRINFLNVKTATPVYSAFMEMLAERIQRETTERDVTNSNTAFGYFAGTQMWRQFAQTCIRDGDGDLYTTTRREMIWTSRLEKKVTTGYLELQRDSLESLQVLLNRKRKHCDGDDDTYEIDRPRTPTDRPEKFQDPHRDITPFKRRVLCHVKSGLNLSCGNSYNSSALEGASPAFRTFAQRLGVV